MKTKYLVMGLAMCFMIIGFAALDANAMIIEILCTESEPCGKYTGTTDDGTVFRADPNPTLPSTGTGVFEPFKRVQNNGLQNGFNTDAGEPVINFDTKNGSNWTRSVLFGELGLVEIEGLLYYQLQLDANENGSADSDKNKITISDMQIYIGGDADLANPEATGLGVYGNGYTGTIFDSTDNSLLNLAPVWTLDSAVNGDVDVILQASICDSNGQCGSGHGDLDVFIPESQLQGSATDYFVLYTEYDGADSAFEPWSGFEEWRFNAQAVPEASTLLLLGSGLVGLGFIRRKLKR